MPHRILYWLNQWLARTIESIPSWARRVLMFLVGVVVPIVCIALDDGLFVLRPALTGLTAMIFFGIELTALTLWLVFPRPSPFLAGVFGAGTVFAAGMSLLLFPFALVFAMEMMFSRSVGGFWFDLVYGFCCWSPILVACVYGRSAMLAFRATSGTRSSQSLVQLVAGFLLAIGVPIATFGFVRYQISDGLRTLLAPTTALNSTALDELRPYKRYLTGSELREIYAGETDPTRREKLALASLELFGWPVDCDSCPPDD